MFKNTIYFQFLTKTELEIRKGIIRRCFDSIFFPSVIYLHATDATA